MSLHTYLVTQRITLPGWIKYVGVEMMRNSFCWLQWEVSATGKIQQNVRIQITKLIQNKTRQWLFFVKLQQTKNRHNHIFGL